MLLMHVNSLMQSDIVLKRIKTLTILIPQYLILADKMIGRDSYEKKHEMENWINIY